MWVKDEWSGGDAVAVTRKNSYTGFKYISSGSSGAKYKPFFNVNPNYLGSWDMSYSFPSYNENTISYYAKLTFGD